VMDEKTYADPRVRAIMAKHFIAVRVDQDSRPDLSNRYEDYGWPATVIYDWNGRELAKLSGYIPPERMISLLTAFVADPTPGPSAMAPPAAEVQPGKFTPALREELIRLHLERFDERLAGWGFVHKYLEPHSMEYAMERARQGDKGAEKMVRHTLDAALGLLDPVWGGAYQYSDSGVWVNPHFEKIMAVQADNMRLYARAYLLWGNPEYLKGAQNVRRYLQDFLTSPQGAFYTSQDADLVHGEHSAEFFAMDDAARRAKGIPRVDTHVYARENGWAIEALCALHAAGDAEALNMALKAADWMVANRSLPGGGFRHGEKDPGGPYLGDTLAMARAFLALYEATADVAWLRRAEASAEFIGARFKRPAGFATAPGWQPQREENGWLARFANSLARYTGKAQYAAMAEHARGWLAQPAVARGGATGAALLVDAELAGEPLHVTVVGAHSDTATRDLLAAALRAAGPYRRVEVWDPAGAPLPSMDVAYPRLERAAAFVCANGRCSLPSYTAAELARRLNKTQSNSKGGP